MADEKSKNLTGADGPDKDPAQPEAGGSPAPGKAQKAPEAAAPEKTVKEPEKATPEKAEKWIIVNKVDKKNYRGKENSA
jgi:hypothetical protein